MELRICCDKKIELTNFNNLKEVNCKLDNYKFDNGQLIGSCYIFGIYNTKSLEDKDFSEEVPFTLMFKNSDYNVDNINIENFKSYEVVNNGIECSFEIVISYSLKDSSEKDNELNKDLENSDMINNEVIVNENKSDNIIEKEEEKDIINNDEVIETIGEKINVNNDFINEIKEEELSNLDEPIAVIKEKYDNLLNNIFLNRDNDNIKIETKESNNKIKFKFKDNNERSSYVVYYPKYENEIEKICLNEKVSINSVYDNDCNKDFQDKKRIIIRK